MVGAIIYFDGPDGVGKTTQLKLVVTALQAEGRTVHVTRALGGTPIGELLREVALTDTVRPAETDLHIALACQYALIEDVLKRREQGEIVLIDRSPLSIVGYQVFGDGLAPEAGYKAAEDLLQLYKPDLILVYMADTATLIERRDQRDHAERHNYFENKPDDYHARVREGFIESSERFGASMITAGENADDVLVSTMKHVREALDTTS